jgi:predicted dehydrogenase
MKKQRIAVVGAGYLGSIHAQKVNNIESAELVAIVDCDQQRAVSVASKYGCASFTEIAQIDANHVDAVVIATITPAHYKVAKYFLQRGVHCFIEKPITTTLDEATDLIELAKDNHCLIQVGHVERFNGAFKALDKIITCPRFVESYRIAPYQPRGTHVDVILDLMIHDIDLVAALFKSDVVDIQANGAYVFSDQIDIANARITFAGGEVANVTASRAGLKRERVMRVFQPESYTVVDLQEKIYRMYKKSPHYLTTGMTDIEMVKQEFKEEDAIQAELTAFIDSINTGKPCVVPGEDGRKALAIALQIQQKVQESYVNYSHG